MRIRRKVPASRLMKDGQHAIVRNSEVIMIADSIDELFPFKQPDDNIVLFRDNKFWKLTVSYRIDKNGEHFDVRGVGVSYNND